jgi:ferrous iron transport protein A
MSLSLDKIDQNQRVLVEEIKGGHFALKRLMHLGIRKGDEIIIKRTGTFGGPTLITVNSSNVAIGRGLAKKIYVKLLNEH